MEETAVRRPASLGGTSLLTSPRASLRGDLTSPRKVARLPLHMLKPLAQARSRHKNCHIGCTLRSLGVSLVSVGDWVCR